MAQVTLNAKFHSLPFTLQSIIVAVPLAFSLVSIQQLRSFTLAGRIVRVIAPGREFRFDVWGVNVSMMGPPSYGGLFSRLFFKTASSCCFLCGQMNLWFYLVFTF